MACRERAPRAGDLVRLVARDGGVVVDPTRRAPGRGAWVHAAAPCLDRVARERGRLRQALGGEVTVPRDLLQHVRAALAADLGSLILRAARAGALVSGPHDLAAASAAARLGALAVASDASPRSEAALTASTPGIPRVRVPLDRAALGALLGRGPRAAVGTTPSRAADPLADRLRALARLG